MIPAARRMHEPSILVIEALSPNNATLITTTEILRLTPQKKWLPGPQSLALLAN